MTYINMDWNPPDPEPGYSWPRWYLDQIKEHRKRQAEERRKQDYSDLPLFARGETKVNRRELEFADLISKVQGCQLCSRMVGRRRVLGPGNGNLNSPVVFVGEAPGRLGADRYGIPLYGDQAGRNFDFFIAEAGIKRTDIFITNAVLCNPRSDTGNNDSPKPAEIRNCSVHLKRLVEIIKPGYVVTLGAVALKALDNIHSLKIDLSKAVGQAREWNGCQVYPLFHPGSRAFIWRSRAVQSQDYKALGDLLDCSDLPLFAQVQE